MGGVLGDVISVADSFRGHAREWFGPFAGIVTTSVQLLAGALALLMVGAGPKVWAPPGQGIPDFAPRIAGLVSVVGVAILYIASRDATAAISFLQVAIWSAGALLLAAIAYIVAYQSLTLRCPGEKTIYVRGFFLVPDARRVLDNDQGPPPLPDFRRITGDTRPSDARNYFCGVFRDRPELVWTRASIDAAKLLLVLLYIPLAVSIIMLLAAAALAVQQVDTKVVEAPTATIAQVPADILFEFNRSDLKPGATGTLEGLAKLIRDHWTAGPVIVAGYTDSIGDDAINLRISRDRAMHVAQWLAKQGKLSNVVFDIQGHGKATPVAPNSFPDGSDNPEGRRLNRRVVVVIPRDS